MRRAGLMGAVIAIVIGLSVPAGNGARSASRIVDRTIVCSMLGVGSPDVVRFVNASVTPFQPANETPPIVTATNGGGAGSGVGATVWTRGRAGSPTGQVSMTRTEGTRCLQTKLRAPLSSAGLVGGTTQPFGVSFRCDVPAKVLIRVRAVFRRPTSFAVDPRNRNWVIAKGSVETASVAVSTVRGLKPILVGSVNDATGKARMFAARSRCTES